MRPLNATRRLTLITMLMAMSLLVHMIESAVPLPIPGVKLGLANIMGLIALLLFDAKTMLSINVMRVILGSLLRGILFGTGFWLSFGGVLISSFVTILAYRQNKLSIVGISVASSAFHGLGQILVLMFINQTILMVYWLPVLWLSAVPTGYLTGRLSHAMLQRIRI
jgi:heptaprenyl diphosphate synthase